MNKDFSKLCTPAKIYFVIAVIACIIALFKGMGIVVVFMKLVFAFIWTYILSWLCNEGYKSLSWFLVLLPYAFMFLVMIGMMNYSAMMSMMGGNMMNMMSGNMMYIMKPVMMHEGMSSNMMSSGMMKPNMMSSGMMKPGMMKPGMMKPGMMKPGMMNQ
jgi:hypothetical protein